MKLLWSFVGPLLSYRSNFCSSPFFIDCIIKGNMMQPYFKMSSGATLRRDGFSKQSTKCGGRGDEQSQACRKMLLRRYLRGPRTRLTEKSPPLCPKDATKRRADLMAARKDSNATITTSATITIGD